MEAVIAKAAQDVAEMLSGVDYLESNFRTSLLVCYAPRNSTCSKKSSFHTLLTKIPFGHGFVDIVILTPDGAILLELKTTKKDCTRQLQKYMKNWRYTPVVGGATINFVGDEAKVAFV